MQKPPKISPLFKKFAKKIRPSAEMHQSGLLVSVIRNRFQKVADAYALPTEPNRFIFSSTFARIAS